MRKILIAPSLLAADKNRLVEEVLVAKESGADWLHFDVMDAKFVPNTALSLGELRQVNAVTDMFLDVHLMIEDPFSQVDKYMDAGADLVTFHYEALTSSRQIHDLIQVMKRRGVMVGLSIKPNTPVAVVTPFLKYLDLVLIMGVEPGKGGQKFISSSLAKIAFLRQLIDQNHYPCLIELDGGINQETAQLCKQAGVDILVAGSYLFGHSNFKERLDWIK